MPEEDLTIDQLRKLAAEIGMTRLTDEHLQQLLRATKAARARRAGLPLELGPADEPAYVYTLDTSPSPLPPLPSGEGKGTAGTSSRGGER